MRSEQQPIKASPSSQSMDRDPLKTKPAQNRNKDERLNIIADLLARVLTLAEIGRHVGLSEGWLTQIARAYGLTSPHRAGRPSLDRRQLKILAFIRDFTACNPLPPTVREIVKGCNLSSNSVAQYHLQVLEHRKYATRIPRVARGIALTERGRSMLAAIPDSPVRDELA